jgi:hypothetical protein
MTRWREIRIRTRAAGLRASPYYEWAAASGFVYYGATPWVPVLLGLRDTTAQQFAARALQMQKRKKHEQGWAAQVRVPVFYAVRQERLRKPTRFLAVLATKDFLRTIYDGGDPAGSIECFEIGRAMEVLEELGSPPSEAKHSGQSGRPEVVSAVIDDGVAFGHDRFWDAPEATRIEYVWDQLVPATEMTGTWGYGRQIDKRDPAEGIDRKLQDSRQAGLVDEDKFYRLMRQVDHSLPGHKPLSLRAAHGAHVMDIACNGFGRLQPGTRPIVAVQLPTATTADTSGATLAPQIYNGLCYVMDRASAIAANAGTGQLPVVVNVSYGIIAGPHDGSSPLEQAMDELLDSANPVDAEGNPTAPPFRVVLPAGNNFHSRCHANVCLPKAKARELHWRALPDDWTETYVEIWMPDRDESGNPASLAVTITAPDGTSTGAFSEGVVQELLADAGLAGWAAYYPPGVAGRRALLRLSLAPTGWPDGGMNLAPAGLYRLRIENTGKAEVKDIHAWIQRDDTPLGYRRRGRQSYFDDPKYQRFDNAGRLIESDPVAPPGVEDSYVKRDGTLNAIATGKHPIVVGGLRRSDWKPAAYTGSGPVVLPPGRGSPCNEGPDVLTISDDTPSHSGVLAAGARSGSAVPLQGTSVAAPQIASWVAEELAQGRAGDREAVAEYTKKIVAPPRYTERNPPAGAAAKPMPKRGGEGRIEFPSLRRPRAERL